MNYQEWIESLPASVTGDALWRMEVYRLALFLQHLTWIDTTALAGHRVTRSLADQLYRAVGSIGANIAEGYSRSSSRDQARFYEYAMGSAREARHWYLGSTGVLGETVVAHRLELTSLAIRHLLRIVKHHRSLREETTNYEIPSPLLTDIPLPPHLQ